MIRGYENEAAETNRPEVFALSCRGCHLGNDDSLLPIHGRAGAPKPLHQGLPPIHLQKLSCTTCHSGNWPGKQAINIKTSMAHGLGLPNVNKKQKSLPHIVSPVYVRDRNGIITPRNLLWPTYWAELKADTLYPLTKNIYAPIAHAIIAYYDSLQTGDWPVLADTHLIKILDTLSALGTVENKPVYVSGNKIYMINDQGDLEHTTRKSLHPYTWPIAHDVRPAAQSLGINGCDDCHSTNSNFYFAEIALDSPVLLSRMSSDRMTHYLEENKIAVWIFSTSFLFRPWLKYIILFSSIIILAVLLLYGFKGLARLTTYTSMAGINQSEKK
jgi:hypothetical protein